MEYTKYTSPYGKVIEDDHKEIYWSESQIAIEQHHQGFRTTALDEETGLGRMFAILLEVEQGDQQAADEEERVHREGGIANHLIPKGTLRDDPFKLPILLGYYGLLLFTMPSTYFIFANGEHLQIGVYHHGPQNREDPQTMQTGSVSLLRESSSSR